ncbi:hypothetical protein MYU51_007107 [Penicillium brevicompactum]
MEQTSLGEVEAGMATGDSHQTQTEPLETETGITDNSPQPNGHDQNEPHQDQKKQITKSESDTKDSILKSDDDKVQKIEPNTQSTAPNDNDHEQKVKIDPNEGTASSDDHGQKVKLETQDKPTISEEVPSHKTLMSSISNFGMPCRACLNKKIEDPSIICCTDPGRKRCTACNQGNKRCIRVPEEVKEELLTWLSIRNPDDAKIQYQILKESIRSSGAASRAARQLKRANEETSQNPRPAKAARTSSPQAGVPEEAALNEGIMAPSDQVNKPSDITMDQVRQEVLKMLGEFRSEIQNLTKCLEEMDTGKDTENLATQE